MGSNDVRDGVLDALVRTYGPQECEGKGWYFTKMYTHKHNNYTADVCLQMSVDILALLAWAQFAGPQLRMRVEHFEEDRLGEIQNLIWMVMPGGGTAEIAAKRVCDAIGIDY